MKKSLFLAAGVGFAAFASPALARDGAPFTLDATRAEIVAGPSRIPLQSTDGLFDRAFISESGPTKIHLALPELLPGVEVSITAPNGGNVRTKAPSDLPGKTFTPGGDFAQRDGKLRFTPLQSGAMELDLDFTPTLGRGAYTITIRQGGAVATLDLWAGKPNPVGQPGPAYVPVRNTEPETVP